MGTDTTHAPTNGGNLKPDGTDDLVVVVVGGTFAALKNDVMLDAPITCGQLAEILGNQPADRPVVLAHEGPDPATGSPLNDLVTGCYLPTERLRGDLILPERTDDLLAEEETQLCLVLIPLQGRDD